MPNGNFKPMDVHKSPIPHFHIIQTKEFIPEVNGDKEILVKGRDYEHSPHIDVAQVNPALSL